MVDFVLRGFGFPTNGLVLSSFGQKDYRRSISSWASSCLQLSVFASKEQRRIAFVVLLRTVVRMNLAFVFSSSKTCFVTTGDTFHSCFVFELENAGIVFSS